MTSIHPRLHIISQLEHVTQPEQFTASYSQAEARYEKLHSLHSYQFLIMITSLFVGTIGALIASRKNPSIISRILLGSIALALTPSMIEMYALWKKVHEECKLHNLLKDMQLELRYAWQAKSDAICECVSSYEKIPAESRESRDLVLKHMEFVTNCYLQQNLLFLPTETKDPFSFLSKEGNLWRETYSKYTAQAALSLNQMDPNTAHVLKAYVPHYFHGLKEIRSEALHLFQKPSYIIDPDKTPSFVKLEYNDSPILKTDSLETQVDKESIPEPIHPRIQTKPWVVSAISETYLKPSLWNIILYSFFQIKRAFHYKQDFSVKTKQDERLETLNVS